MVTKEISTVSDTPNERARTVNKNYGRDQNFNTGGGSLNTGPQYNVAGDLVQSFTSAVSNPHRTLWDMVAGVKASHNSDLQFERGDCLPGTRTAILEDLHEWRLPENGGLPVCWLSGPAGVGKSAVALTLAKACEGDGLAGTFFFFRSDPKRNNPSALILTIAHGLVVTNPGTGRRINRRIATDPRILEASLEEQYRELIFNPLKEKKRWWRWLQELWPGSRSPRPNLVIIDGLDECNDSEVQTRVLSVIFSSFTGSSPRIPPLRFLICSRPESWIREAFESTQFRRLTKQVVLDNSFSARKDIEHYFLQSFQEIRRSAKYGHVDFPDPWPAHYIVELLVNKASGQFIYAVTVIRFIKGDFAHPFEQLRIVLDTPPPPHSKSPFHELNILYHIVLSANPDHKQLSLFLAAILLLPRHASPAFLDMLFELRSGAASLALRAMHSVLDIRGLDDPISVYHTSFTDFLKDESRSERFFIDLPSQRISLMRRWGRVLRKSWKNNLRDEHRPSSRFPWTAWADFCLEVPSEEVPRELHKLYATILFACSHHNEVVSILAAVILLPATTSVTPQYIETFLEYTPSQATRALHELNWVLSGGPKERLTIAHTSLTSFLLDQSRSGRFFIDRDCHQDYFVRRWLRVYPLFSELERTLPLRSWHELCAELDIPETKLRKFYQDPRYFLLRRDKLTSWYKLCSELGIPQNTITSELLNFYEDLRYVLLNNHDQLPRSVIATIAVLSRYAKPSLELIDILHKTSKDPDLYYYLHIGTKEDIHPFSADSYPSFFDFLQNSCQPHDLLDLSFPRGHQDFLARRMVESVVWLCQGLTEKFEPGSPQRFLWDTWCDICCAVDEPSEELLYALEDIPCDAVVAASIRIVDHSGIPSRPHAPLRQNPRRFWPLLIRRCERISEWLQSKASQSNVLEEGAHHNTTLIESFERIHCEFELQFYPPESQPVALCLAVHALLDIADCKYRVSLSTLSISSDGHLNSGLKHISRCTRVCCSVFDQSRSFSRNTNYWHVDIRTGCRKIAHALASDLKSAEYRVEELAVVLNVLDSSLLPLCGHKYDLLNFFSSVLDAAEDLTETTSFQEVVSDYHRHKLLSWLKSFPEEHARQTSSLSRDFLALLS